MRLIDADELFPDGKDMLDIPVGPDEWFETNLNELRKYIDGRPTVDPVKHKTYSKNEMIECLVQIGQRYGDLYMTTFGCTCDIKTYINRMIIRINEEIDVVDE